jgi:hypothetical protein
VDAVRNVAPRVLLFTHRNKRGGIGALDADKGPPRNWRGSTAEEADAGSKMQITLSLMFQDSLMPSALFKKQKELGVVGEIERGFGRTDSGAAAAGGFL